MMGQFSRSWSSFSSPLGSEPCPLQDPLRHPRWFVWYFCHQKVLPPFLPEKARPFSVKSNYNEALTLHKRRSLDPPNEALNTDPWPCQFKTSANVFGVQRLRVCSHFFCFDRKSSSDSRSQSRFCRMHPPEVSYLYYNYIHSLSFICEFKREPSLSQFQLWKTPRVSLRSWLRFEFLICFPFIKSVSKTVWQQKTRRRCENIFCRLMRHRGEITRMLQVGWCFVGMEVWALRYFYLYFFGTCEAVFFFRVPDSQA